MLGCQIVDGVQPVYHQHVVKVFLVQFMMIDFGAEAVVEAVGTAASDNGNYMSEYAVEYARSDMQFFSVNSEDSNSTVRN